MIAHQKYTRAALSAVLAVAFAVTAASAIETDILFGDPVKPNVLVVFDNSGSMNNQPNYDTLAIYTGTYVPGTIYSRCSQYNTNCTCKKTQTSWVVHNGTCGFTDTGSDGIDDKTVYKKMGNRLNYEVLPDKLSTAKAVMNSLLQQPEVTDVRFGLMVYTHTYLPSNYSNYNQVDTWHKDTSVMRSAVQDNNQTNIRNIINNTSASGGTPSGNRLLQAGDYFAGSLSGFSSPIQYECQRNYVIVITDGRPEVEGDTITAMNYGQFDHIEGWLQTNLGADIDPDNDNDESPPGTTFNGGSKYFDDIAWVLQHKDLRPSMPGMQNVTVFTIGYDVNHPILQNAADNGGGRYFTATTADELADALRRTINLIITDAQSFVAPVVPVNALKRTQSGDRLYIALFQPLQASTFWAGNIKKYGIDTQGQLVSPTGAQATDTSGALLTTSSSYWDGAPSGGNVTKGGVGEKLITRSSARNIYTYLGSSDLTSSSNAFTTGNATLTKEILTVADATKRSELIRFIRGEDVYDEDEDDNLTEKRDWILGDFIHSTPLVLPYASGDTVIFAGSNDGQLHAFDDSTGDELWSFVPPAVLPRLKELTPGGAASHPFLVDGSPRKLVTDSGQVIVIFGLRRGGGYYYALDVTSKTSPQYMWSLSNATSGMSELGLAWSEPATGKMGTTSSFQYVAVFGAGYDTAFDDPTRTAANTTSPKGRAVYVVNALTGAVLNSLQPSGMTFPVAGNISAFDINADETLDLGYLGDVGGNLWRLQLPNTLTKVFTAPPGHKIFTAPDLSIENAYLNVFFGTGDVASPLYEGVVDRLYSFRDDLLSGGFSESNLVDVTDNLVQEGTAAQQQVVLSQLAASRGWYVRLTRSGEKCLASPLVFFDVFFTTFVPTSEICSGGGDAYLYVLGFDAGASTTDLDANGTMNAADRRIDIGSSIPTEVTPTIREEDAIGYIGVGGAIPRVQLPGPPLNVIPIYWREMY